MATAFHSEAHLDEGNPVSPEGNMSHTYNGVEFQRGILSLQSPVARLHSN